jgi:hypothetical protein
MSHTDIFYQNIDSTFFSGIVTGDGYASLEEFVDAIYQIFDTRGDKYVELTLGNGISKEGTNFIISLSDDDLKYSGFRYHQLIGINANGVKTLVFKNNLKIVGAP